MIRLIINIILLAILAVFIALNVSYTTNVNLFGYVFEDISTVAVICVSLVAGVIFSFYYYVMEFITKVIKNRRKKVKQKTKTKEKELTEREKQLTETLNAGIAEAKKNKQTDETR